MSERKSYYQVLVLDRLKNEIVRLKEDAKAKGMYPIAMITEALGLGMKAYRKKHNMEENNG